MNDLLGGHVPMAFGVLPPALGNIQAGKLRAVAVTSLKRSSLLPDMPTFDEFGPARLRRRAALWRAGAGRHAEGDRRQAQRRIAQDGRTEEVQKRIHAEGGDPLTSTPAEYAADIDKEEKKWGGLVKKLGLKVE